MRLVLLVRTLVALVMILMCLCTEGLGHIYVEKKPLVTNNN